MADVEEEKEKETETLVMIEEYIDQTLPRIFEKSSRSLKNALKGAARSYLTQNSGSLPPLLNLAISIENKKLPKPPATKTVAEESKDGPTQELLRIWQEMKTPTSSPQAQRREMGPTSGSRPPTPLSSSPREGDHQLSKSVEDRQSGEKGAPLTTKKLNHLPAIGLFPCVKMGRHKVGFSATPIHEWRAGDSTVTILTGSSSSGKSLVLDILSQQERGGINPSHNLLSLHKIPVIGYEHREAAEFHLFFVKNDFDGKSYIQESHRDPHSLFTIFRSNPFEAPLDDPQVITALLRLTSLAEFPSQHQGVAQVVKDVNSGDSSCSGESLQGPIIDADFKVSSDPEGTPRSSPQKCSLGNEGGLGRSSTTSMRRGGSRLSMVSDVQRLDSELSSLINSKVQGDPHQVSIEPSDLWVQNLASLVRVVSVAFNAVFPKKRISLVLVDHNLFPVPSSLLCHFLVHENKLIPDILILHSMEQLCRYQPYDELHLAGGGMRSTASILFHLALLAAVHLSPSLFLLDEPEVHLHPEQCRSLAMQLIQMLPSSMHLVVSTHSSDFIHHLVLATSAKPPSFTLTSSSSSSSFFPPSKSFFSPPHSSSTLLPLSDSSRQNTTDRPGSGSEAGFKRSTSHESCGAPREVFFLRLQRVEIETENVPVTKICKASPSNLFGKEGKAKNPGLALFTKAIDGLFFERVIVVESFNDAFVYEQMWHLFKDWGILDFQVPPPLFVPLGGRDRYKDVYNFYKASGVSFTIMLDIDAITSLAMDPEFSSKSSAFRAWQQHYQNVLLPLLRGKDNSIVLSAYRSLKGVDQEFLSSLDGIDPGFSLVWEGSLEPLVQGLIDLANSVLEENNDRSMNSRNGRSPSRKSKRNHLSSTGSRGGNTSEVDESDAESGDEGSFVDSRRDVNHSAMLRGPLLSETDGAGRYKLHRSTKFSGGDQEMFLEMLSLLRSNRHLFEEKVCSLFCIMFRVAKALEATNTPPLPSQNPIPLDFQKLIDGQDVCQDSELHSYRFLTHHSIGSFPTS